jgi:equilibrative nucleoside transporter 1/2/3
LHALAGAPDWESVFPGRHTDRLLTVSYLPVNLATVSAMVCLHGAVRPRLRIQAGLSGFTLALAAVTLMNHSSGAAAALAALLALVAACGACDGLASGALYGEAAVLSSRYTQALATGNSLSGIAVSLLRLGTKATLPDSPDGLRRSANLYFCISAAACLGCVLLYSWVLPRLPGVRRRREAALAAALLSYGPLPDALPPSEYGEVAEEAGEAVPKIRHPDVMDGGQGQQAVLDAEQPAVNGSTVTHHRRQQQQAGEAAPLLGEAQHSSVALLRRMWRLALANGLVFIVTLSIFPGVLAEDLHSPQLGSWYPILLLTAYNCADAAGKAASGWRPLRLRDDQAILAAAAARALFIPAFRLAAVSQAGVPAVLLLTAALGSSNGFVCACAMIRAPSTVPPAAAGLAGNLMVLSLVLGLCLGAAASFLWLLLPAEAPALALGWLH